MTRPVVGIVVVLLTLIWAILLFYFDIDDILSAVNGMRRDPVGFVSSVKPRLDSFRSSLGELCFRVGFATVYVTTTATSVPGAAALSLMAGALFGLHWGVVIVSFSSTLGASLAFLAARSLFKDAVQRKLKRLGFADQLEAVNAGVRDQGAFYLLSLRLFPAVPFFVVNLLCSFSSMPLRTFYWATQVGTIPGTIIFVNAGTQLSRLESLSDVLSFRIWGSFALLGVFPWVAKSLFALITSRSAGR